MAVRPVSVHTCMSCGNNFKIKVHERESGDAFLRCPFCKKDHYRNFKDGAVRHASLSRAKREPFVIKGFK